MTRIIMGEKQIKFELTVNRDVNKQYIEQHQRNSSQTRRLTKLYMAKRQVKITAICLENAN